MSGGVTGRRRKTSVRLQRCPVGKLIGPFGPASGVKVWSQFSFQGFRFQQGGAREPRPDRPLLSRRRSNEAPIRGGEEGPK